MRELRHGLLTMVLLLASEVVKAWTEAMMANGSGPAAGADRTLRLHNSDQSHLVKTEAALEDPLDN